MDSPAYMPHGHCYFWKPELIWLHVTSDLIITLSYYSIPFVLVYFIFRKREIPFNWMFLMFALFIFACGTTHLLEIVNVWKAHYVLAGCIKLFTAIVSLITACALMRIIPKILGLENKGILLMSYNELQDELERLRYERDTLIKREADHETK